MPGRGGGGGGEGVEEGEGGVEEGEEAEGGSATHPPPLRSSMASVTFWGKPFKC